VKKPFTSTDPEINQGRFPLAKPFNPRPNQCLLRLRQEPKEAREQALERAKQMSWWPRVVNSEPRLFSGYWTWLGKKKKSS